MNVRAFPEAPSEWTPVVVNGVTISREAIAREAQHHPAPNPGAAIRRATKALVIRELLLQETRRQGLEVAPQRDAKGRRETDNEASIRALIDREVIASPPTAAEVRRYYNANHDRFRAPDLVEASHILISARRDEAAAYAAAHEKADAILAELQALPDSFVELARVFSDCSSSVDGGHLGQLVPGDTTPEFEAAVARLEEGEVTLEPVATRYGLHIIRLERRVEGSVLHLSTVADSIAAYLAEHGRRLALARYVARLVSNADLTGAAVPATAFRAGQAPGQPAIVGRPLPRGSVAQSGEFQRL